MSGHSKWSKVKHQKATTDASKSAAFTRAARAITISVKEGGGITDPNQNFHLRLAIEKAHDVNMPKDNIQRAIEKAKGAESQSIQQLSYEAYGPYGVALYIEAASDNVNRTVSFLKQAIEHAKGSMASPGAVSYQFHRRGVVLVPKTLSYDALLEQALEIGSEDVVETDDFFELYAQADTLMQMKTALEERGVPIDSYSIVMQPLHPVVLTEEQQKSIADLVDRIEESDDIQRVFAAY